MHLLAHASEKPAPHLLDWGQPLGVVVFVVGIALTLFLLAATIKTLASIDPEQKKKRK